MAEPQPQADTSATTLSNPSPVNKADADVDATDSPQSISTINSPAREDKGKGKGVDTSEEIPIQEGNGKAKQRELDIPASFDPPLPGAQTEDSGHIDDDEAYAKGYDLAMHEIAGDRIDITLLPSDARDGSDFCDAFFRGYWDARYAEDDRIRDEREAAHEYYFPTVEDTDDDTDDDTEVRIFHSNVLHALPNEEYSPDITNPTVLTNHTLRHLDGRVNPSLVQESTNEEKFTAEIEALIHALKNPTPQQKTSVLVARLREANNRIERLQRALSGMRQESMSAMEENVSRMEDGLDHEDDRSHLTHYRTETKNLESGVAAEFKRFLQSTAPVSIPILSDSDADTEEVGSGPERQVDQAPAGKPRDSSSDVQLDRKPIAKAAPAPKPEPRTNTAKSRSRSIQRMQCRHSQTPTYLCPFEFEVLAKKATSGYLEPKPHPTSTHSFSEIPAIDPFLDRYGSCHEEIKAAQKEREQRYRELAVRVKEVRERLREDAKERKERQEQRKQERAMTLYLRDLKAVARRLGISLYEAQDLLKKETDYHPKPTRR